MSTLGNLTGFSAGKTDLMLEAQTLWDATMAHSLAAAAVSPEAAADGAADGVARMMGGSDRARGAKRPLIVHVCGKFHCNAYRRMCAVHAHRPMCALRAFSRNLMRSAFAYAFTERLRLTRIPP